MGFFHGIYRIYVWFLDGKWEYIYVYISVCVRLYTVFICFIRVNYQQFRAVWNGQLGKVEHLTNQKKVV